MANASRASSRGRAAIGATILLLLVVAGCGKYGAPRRSPPTADAIEQANPGVDAGVDAGAATGEDDERSKGKQER